jgi:hypothetical protein
MNEELKITLPLRNAYPFGSVHGLDREVTDIRKMAIKSDRSPSVRRGYIVELFEKHGLFEKFKKEHWPFGNIPQRGETICRWYVHIKDKYEEANRSPGV